jgi:hypothetical protein
MERARMRERERKREREREREKGKLAFTLGRKEGNAMEQLVFDDEVFGFSRLIKPFIAQPAKSTDWLAALQVAFALVCLGCLSVCLSTAAAAVTGQQIDGSRRQH